MLCIATAMLYAQEYTLYQGEESQFGLKDKTGNIIIKAKYRFISPILSEGYTWGAIDDKIAFINKDGKEITPFKYDDVTDFLNGFAQVNIGAELDEFNGEMYGGKWGFINAQGKEIIALKYDYLSGFTKEGFAIAYIGEKSTLINTSGKELVPLKYDYIKISTADPEIAVVNIGGRYDTLFGELSFNQFVGGNQGFINCVTGKEIVPVKFSVVGDFSEGVAPVNAGAVFNGAGYDGGKWGFIDKTGKTVIPLQYDNAGYFFKGRAEVTLNGKTFFIDKTGKEIK